MIGTYEHLISYTNLSLLSRTLKKRGQQFIQLLKLSAFQICFKFVLDFCKLDGVSLLFQFLFDGS